MNSAVNINHSVQRYIQVNDILQQSCKGIYILAKWKKIAFLPIDKC